jgi:hypothetical protein
MVERLHGDRAVEHIGDRMADLARKGDHAGVQRWLEIADRLNQLRDPGAARS